MEGLTASEMAKMLNLPIDTVKQRLKRAGLKPITKERVYHASALEAIREAPMGRPKKAPDEEGGK
jgi:hypothetical protein